ncbi:hypothetical protein CEXT_38371 [Caerostris extrusa]|uniref:Uncharacterized protein n=1 Tax=Caerostris extrusa TaxID=172846 RepID=A0AAV4TXV3_CAEEX|nr:hypothetical protein CEXT_38371 [Caerostris extrusa]
MTVITVGSLQNSQETITGFQQKKKGKLKPGHLHTKMALINKYCKQTLTTIVINIVSYQIYHFGDLEREVQTASDLLYANLSSQNFLHTVFILVTAFDVKKKEKRENQS